jgi:hypothetical protein
LRKLIIRKKLETVKSAAEYIEYLSDPGIKSVLKAKDLPAEFHCTDQASYLQRSKYLRQATNSQPAISEEALDFIKSNVPAGGIITGEQSMLSNWVALKCDFPIAYPRNTADLFNTPSIGSMSNGTIDKLKGAAGKAYTFATQKEKIPAIIKSRHKTRSSSERSIQAITGAGIKSATPRIIDVSVHNGDYIYQNMRAADIGTMLCSDVSKKITYYLIGIGRVCARGISHTEDLSKIFSAEETGLQVGIEGLTTKLSKDFGVGNSTTQIKAKSKSKWQVLDNGDVVYVIKLRISSTPGKTEYPNLSVPWADKEADKKRHLGWQYSEPLRATNPDTRLNEANTSAPPITITGDAVLSSTLGTAALNLPYDPSQYQQQMQNMQRQMQDMQQRMQQQQMAEYARQQTMQLIRSTTPDLIRAAASDDMRATRNAQIQAMQRAMPTGGLGAPRRYEEYFTTANSGMQRGTAGTSLEQEVRRAYRRRFQSMVELYQNSGDSVDSFALGILRALESPQLELLAKEELIQAVISHVNEADLEQIATALLYPALVQNPSFSADEFLEAAPNVGRILGLPVENLTPAENATPPAGPYESPEQRVVIRMGGEPQEPVPYDSEDDPQTETND